MNFEEYKQYAINKLMEAKPEWTEVAEPTSAINIVATTLAMAYPAIESEKTEALNNLSVYTADFTHLLQGYGSMHNVLYKEATSSKILTEIDATGQMTLNKGEEVTDTAGNVYLLEENVNLVEGKNEAIFVAREKGSIIPNNDTLTLSNTYENIRNIAFKKVIVYGTETESEESFRLRCYNSQLGLNSMTTDLEYKLLNQANCEKVYIFYNTTSQNIDFVKSNSFAVITYGGDEDTIFDILASYRITKTTSYDTLTGKTKLFNINNDKNEGSQLLVAYTPANVKFYYIKLKLANNVTLTDEMLNKITSAINESMNFRKKVFSNDIIIIVNNILTSYNLSLTIKDCLFSFTNNDEDYKNTIEPEKINDLILIKKENIILNFE